jgi:hypothetical protein
VPRGVGLALLVALSRVIAGCYEVPEPDCGFACGPSGACPDGYLCASELRCHRIGTPPTLVCNPPADAAIDGQVNATAELHRAPR